MKQIFVIFVLLWLALPASAQSAEEGRKSVAPMKFVSKTQKNVSLDEFAKTLRSSDAFARTNALAIGETKLPLEGDKFEWMLTKKDNLKMRFSGMIGPGTHTLSEVSPTGAVTEVVLQDTILEYAVLDLSTFVRIDSDDEGDPGFLFPANQAGTNRIFKSYAKNPPEGGADGGDVVAKNSTGTSSDEETKKSIDIDWVNDNAFFYEGVMYQKDSTGKFVPEDPNAPKVMSLGKTGLFGLGREQMVLVTKDAQGVWGPSAMNVVNAPKRGLGPFAGYPWGTYINGGYPVSGLYQNMAFTGMGTGLGIGSNCFGISIGASFGVNMGLYGGGNICNPYMTQGYVIGHPVWDPYTQQIFHAQTGGYAYGNGGGFGYGGCKSAVVNTPVVESAEAKVSQVETSGNGRIFTNGPVNIDAPKSNVGQFDFTDIAPKDLRSSGATAYAGDIKGSDDRSVMADHSFSTNPSVPVEKTPERQVTPTLEFGDTHTGVGLRGNGGASMGGGETGNSHTKPQQEPLAFDDSHTINRSVFGARNGSTTPTQKPLAQDGGGVIQAPAPVGRNTGDVASSGTVSTPTAPVLRGADGGGRTGTDRTNVRRNAEVTPSVNTVSTSTAPVLRGANSEGRTSTDRTNVRRNAEVTPSVNTVSTSTAPVLRGANTDGRPSVGHSGSDVKIPTGAGNPSGTLRGANGGRRTGGGRSLSTNAPIRSKQ